ncbi:MAG: MTH938/NDUFAF3 family protein [Pseudomonadota bacterium]
MADAVQFNLEKGAGSKLVEDYSTGRVTIDGQTYTESLVLLPDRVLENWPIASSADLHIALLEEAIAAEPEVLLLGTGKTQAFPSIELMKALAMKNRSMDVMDSAAACRTYNVLVSEFRQVVLALIM